MRLPALLGHSSELLRIIRKSYQPSDMIMSDYFRKKKYIGSSERRFLSGLVFTTLRNYSLIEYSYTTAIKKNTWDLSNKQIDSELFIAVSAVFLFEVNKYFHSVFHPSELIGKFIEYENIDFLENLIISLSEKANIGRKESEEFFQSLEFSFEELDSKSKQIQEPNTEFSEDNIQVIAKRFSMPEWIIHRFGSNNFQKLSIKEICNLTESLLNPAPLTIRVNLSCISREEVLNNLIENEIGCKPCALSPSGIILSKRTQLNTLDIFKKGLIEVQDEGSQLISIALSPEENEKILDACAGAGGKSLHIADIQKNFGAIIANDVDFRKLKELLKRAKRSGFNSIKTQNLSNINKIPISSKMGNNEMVFDRVLVDAPCSGMGTVRRMPMQKWRLTPELLKKFSDKQTKILEYYSKFVSIGGVLLYSTCSLMAEENEEIIENFLSNNLNFQPYPLNPAFDRFKIKIDGLKEDDFMLRLSPDKHGCDGFFIAKMIREE